MGKKEMPKGEVAGSGPHYRLRQPKIVRQWWPSSLIFHIARRIPNGNANCNLTLNYHLSRAIPRIVSFGAIVYATRQPDERPCLHRCLAECAGGRETTNRLPDAAENGGHPDLHSGGRFRLQPH